MDRKKQKRLEKAGWRLGSASEFLRLTSAEEQLVEMKLSLGTRLRKARQRHNLTQAALADRMGSSQSRVAKWKPVTRPSRSTFWSKGCWRPAQLAERSLTPSPQRRRSRAPNVPGFSCAGRANARAASAANRS